MRTMINILPASYRRQQMVRNRCVQWSTILAVVLALGWGWHAIELRERSHLLEQLDLLSREHAPTQAMLKQVVDMRQQLKELQEHETIAKVLETQRNVLTLLGVVSQTAQNTNGMLRLTKMELKNFQSAAVATKPGEANGAAPGLLLEGVSLDNKPLADFVEGLQHSGIFSRVVFKVDKRADNKSPLCDYTVQCEF
ncbi:MAG: PilN domain-containing protein [Pirellulales bacterium]